MAAPSESNSGFTLLTVPMSLVVSLLDRERCRQPDDLFPKDESMFLSNRKGSTLTRERLGLTPKLAHIEQNCIPCKDGAGSEADEMDTRSNASSRISTTTSRLYASSLTSTSAMCYWYIPQEWSGLAEERLASCHSLLNANIQTAAMGDRRRSERCCASTALHQQHHCLQR